MILPRIGVKLKLVPFESKYASVVSSWYYDVRYKFYFREFEDLPFTTDDLSKFGEIMARMGIEVFVILDKETEKPIGLMNNLCLKRKSGVWRFGILLDKEHQNKTYAIEAIILNGFYLYDHCGCRKLVVEFLSTDKQIQRISEKGGFVREAVLQKETLIDGKYVDEVRYFIDLDTANTLYRSYVNALDEMEENKR